MNELLYDSDLDASRVLAAALRQMDEIINGGSNGDRLQGKTDNDKWDCQTSSADVVFFAKGFKSALERSKLDNQDQHLDGLDKNTLLFLCKWIHRQLLLLGNDSIYECDDLQQRICQLELEKEQLTMQVNVLSDQVEAQNEKIMELENSLSQSKEQLNSSESLLRKEMASRSSVESSKLDLMAQISALRIRLSAVENEKREIEERNTKLENELILTCACLAEKEADLAAFKSKLARNGAITPIFDSNPEFERLKGALSSVMAANDEKERKIQEMKTS